MYFEKDTVLRIIQMMGEFFSRLMERADLADREKELDAFCREYGGIPLKGLRELTLDSVTELTNELTRLYLSEALYMDAQLAGWRDRDRYDASLMRSLRLLSTLDEREEIASLRGERLRTLTDELRDRMTEEDFIRCARFFLSAGQYADSEDMVFLAAETAHESERAGYVEAGLDVLRAMLALPEELLVSGGESRAELNDAVNDLRALAEGRDGA